MKTLIELTIVCQILFLLYGIYVIKAGQWSATLYAMRQTLHFALFCILAVNAVSLNLNVFVLVAYLAITLEEFMSMKFFENIAKKFLSPTDGATFELSGPSDHFFSSYIGGILLDFRAIARMTVNTFTSGTPLPHDQRDLMCASIAEELSVPEIVLHPAYFGHEVLRMLFLGLLLFL